MSRVRDAPNVRPGLAEIPDLSRAALAERWVKIYGRPPPKCLGRRLLEYAAAYDLQSQEDGGLKPEARRKLRQLARPGRDAARQTSRPAKAKALAPGSRLVREWCGRTYTVDVLESGFLCDGQQYRSLSELARAITGARWSGPRFFGL
jgi:hypothetical protein